MACEKAYVQVAGDLREQILRGHYVPGQRLPCEQELCAQYSLSRVTIRHALRLLTEQGLIERFVKRGTFVRASSPRKLVIRDGDFCASLLEQAPLVERRLRSCRTIAPTAQISALLRLGPDEKCMMFERVDVLGDEPLGFDRAWAPAKLCNRMDESLLLRLDFLFAWLRKLRLKISHTEQTIEAIEAGPVEAQILATAPKAALLKTREVVFTAPVKPVLVVDSFYRGDRLALNCKILKEGMRVSLSH
ncbi:MAG: GntR family transcriptional regulator [Planctomycetes bacterium]|nr:GntR family transcriptional regulator [Planctomycetota bacterium]